jgi:hypothetical protein
MSRLAAAISLGLLLVCGYGFQTPPGAPANHLADPFATGWMLTDTNGDGIADFVNGKVTVPAHPTAAENTGAANLAARLGYGSTGLTPPLVVNAPAAMGISVARAANAPVPLEPAEGAVLAVEGNLTVTGADDDGLLAAAEAYSARAPYQWKVPGDKIAAIVDAVRGAAPAAHVELAGVTYLRGKAGIHRALLRTTEAIPAEALNAALAKLASVQQLAVIGGATAAKSTAEPNESPATPAAAGGADAAGGANDTSAAPVRLDLATLYTSRGLFTGTPRMPVPSTLSGHLYVPAGAAGIAMANLAARMGMEATGISLPIATPVERANVRDVRNHAVVAGEGAVAEQVRKRLEEWDAAAGDAETPLAPGEGELRVVDDVFARRSAVWTRGDEAGSAAALELLAAHLPNVWEQGKQYLAAEEIRHDLHQFFSRRSAAGQAAAGLYHLARWAAAMDRTGVRDVRAELYVDLADPALKGFIEKVLGVKAEVTASSLRAGTQCCDKDPDLHYHAAGVPFRQAAPAFVEDVAIPWEGRRLVDAVKRVSGKIGAGQPVRLLALVSEGPEQRRKLETQIQELLAKAGAAAGALSVRVLCAYKPGYSWLMDEVAPALAKRPVARIEIDFAKNVDPSGVRAMHSPARWVQELYPVDEMLARKLNLPLEKIALNQIEVPPANGPTYRAHAFDAAGKEILTRDFKVPTVMQPYNGVITRYEEVQVDTGWVRLEAGGKVLLDERIRTDPELFWEHYQNKTLPRVYEYVMRQAHGDLRTEYQPPFDTLRMDIHMSEPDYSLDLDQERISSLEALQEDTFYSTANFVSMWGDLEAGRPMNYTGRIIPIVHRSEDGKDGRVHIEFYAKAAAQPMVALAWADAQGNRHRQERNLPAIAGEMQPRLIQARVKAGEPGIERLMWALAADFADDRYDDWLKVESQDQVDRNIFSVEQASGQLHWLEEMHAAGVYRDALAYGRVKQMAVEFELPLEPHAKADSPAPRKFVSWKVAEPATSRPMIKNVKKAEGTPFVQWDEPIGPAESAAILARLATFPGVNVYWMGRSYLGEDLWAADVTLPTPAVLRSWAKEATTKAGIVYSGRQHANEVSSTTHILKLAEQLVTDPARREALKKVNVVLHPITNPDGAQLSVDLARITPDNMLHPAYHGALSADVSLGQTETDPIYPESRTRRQLVEAWLPDAFLNPHGYPSHEWVQPFSEYSGWVQSRQGANPGRAWWIPRGWFTSIGYLRDESHPHSKMVAYAIQDRIVKAEREVPGLLPLEERMNSRYERFGQRWQPREMLQPLVNGIRIYMALKGSAGPRGGSGGEGGAAGTTAPGSGGVGGLSPFITWDAAYTEAPDETAHGDYLKLVSAAGLAFDYVHLNYLAEGEHKITRTERESGGTVQYRVERARPILPR